MSFKYRSNERIPSRARAMVLSLRQYFECEWQLGGPLIPLDQVIKRTAEALSIGTSSVSRIIQEERTTGKLTTPGKNRTRVCTVTEPDSFTTNAIRQHIYFSYYLRKEYPTIAKLMVSLAEADLYKGSSASLKVLLRKINFRYTKVNGRQILLERNDIVALRATFLRRICAVQDWENIIWLDEMWVNENAAPSKAWTDGTRQSTMPVPVGKGKRLILLHAGNAFGFIPGAELIFESKKSKSADYHDDMNRHVFLKWFKEQLLPNIQPNSIIVIDNAPYHTTYQEKLPTSNWRKEDIRTWLVERGLLSQDASVQYTKAELYEFVKPHKRSLTKYELDEIAKSHGHEIIRLPPYHCQYNVIKLIWARVKPYVGKENKVFNVKKLIEITREAVNAVTPQVWFACVEHVRKLILKAKESEGIIERTVEELIINLGKSESDDDDDDFFSANDDAKCDDDDDDTSILEHVIPSININYSSSRRTLDYDNIENLDLVDYDQTKNVNVVDFDNIENIMMDVGADFLLYLCE